MSKGAEVDSSMCERPEHQRPRRLADWLNPTGERKVHSLIDKARTPHIRQPTGWTELMPEQELEVPVRPRCEHGHLWSDRERSMTQRSSSGTG